jgi:hypothetical protein
MFKRRQRYQSAEKNKGKRFKIKINFKRLVFPSLAILFLGYCIYGYMSFRNIQTINPLENSNANLYLLSSNNDSFRKTLIVFEDKYNGNNRIERVYLFAENRDKKESLLIHIPHWVQYTGLENDFGNAIPVSSFRYAGDFIQPGKGIEYALWQFQQLLGINIDDYIWFDAQSTIVLRENLGEFSSDPSYSHYYANSNEVSSEVYYLNSFISRLGMLNLVFSASSFKDSQAIIYSSISPLPSMVVELKGIQSSIFSTKPYIIDLSRGDFLNQKESERVGGLTNYVRTGQFDIVWRGKITQMLDRELEREMVRVEVYNGSGITGAAGQFARRIRNTGCDVVRYDNAPGEVEETVFYVPNPDDFKKSLNVISEIFPGKYKLVEGRPSFLTTGDIVIILGSDITKMYSF